MFNEHFLILNLNKAIREPLLRGTETRRCARIKKHLGSKTLIDGTNKKDSQASSWF